jgi:hypothetical protein
MYYTADLKDNDIYATSMREHLTSVPANFVTEEFSDTLFIDAVKGSSWVTDSYVVQAILHFPGKKIVSFDYNRKTYFIYKLGMRDKPGHCAAWDAERSVYDVPDKNALCPYAASETTLPDNYTGITSLRHDWSNAYLPVSFEKLNIKIPVDGPKSIHIVYSVSGQNIQILARYASLRWIPGDIALPPMIGCFNTSGIFSGFRGCGFRRHFGEFRSRDKDNWGGEHVLRDLLGFNMFADYPL